MSNRSKSRPFVSLSLFLSLGVMLVTSVLLFTRPHNPVTALMHTVLGSALVLLALWHLKNNLAVLRQHLKLRASTHKPGFNGSPMLALFVCGGLIGAAFFQWGPLMDLYVWGTALRAGAPAVDQQRFTYERLEFAAAGAEGSPLRIDLRTGPSFAWPQYAFWLETLQGDMIQPLYVTRKLADNRFDVKVTPKRRGLSLTSNPLFTANADALFDFVDDPATAGDRARPESLPVFLHKLAAVQPTAGPERATRPAAIDGYAGATLQQSFLLSTRPKTRLAEPYRLRLEINQSFDFNTYYSSDRFPDDPVYSGDGYSAQPSLIYETIIDPTSDQRFYPMRLLGRGHHSGQDGEIHPDLHNMTTALYILDRIIIELSN